MNAMTTPTEPKSPRPALLDPLYWLAIGLLAVLTLLVWSVARDRVVEPFDQFVTDQHCFDKGQDFEREVVEVERSNRFGLVDRSEGFCSFGEGPDGEAPMTLTIDQTAPGPLFRAFKAFGIILQLGIVSIFLRLIVDPVFEMYRAVRGRVSKI